MPCALQRLRFAPRHLTRPARAPGSFVPFGESKPLPLRWAARVRSRLSPCLRAELPGDCFYYKGPVLLLPRPHLTGDTGNEDATFATDGPRGGRSPRTS